MNTTQKTSDVLFLIIYRVWFTLFDDTKKIETTQNQINCSEYESKILNERTQTKNATDTQIDFGQMSSFDHVTSYL